MNNSNSSNNIHHRTDGNDQSHPESTYLQPRLMATKRNVVIGTLNPHHEMNPFNKKVHSGRGASHVIEKISSSRRRWRHLYTKAFDALRGTGLLSNDPFALDWPSLSEPAILPLTMDYFPNPNELRADYTVTELYKLSLPDSDELEEMGYLSDEDLVTELVCQRLAQDFQIVTASDGAGEKLSGGLKYHLMYRHIIHRLTFDAMSRNIEVTVYTHRLKAQRLDNAQYYYPYTVLDLYDNTPHSVGQTFTSIIPIRWGYLDGVIVGYHDQHDKSVRYRRLHYLLVPPLDEPGVTTVKNGSGGSTHTSSSSSSGPALPVGQPSLLPWSTVRDSNVDPGLLLSSSPPVSSSVSLASIGVVWD
jgi:hypothetical protein